MALGPRDLSSLVMLTGWDATELQKFRLRDGTTYAAVVSQIRAAIGALNAEINADPLWASLVSYQDQPDVEYRVGSSNGFQDHTEYGRPDARRAPAGLVVLFQGCATTQMAAARLARREPPRCANLASAAAAAAGPGPWFLRGALRVE